MESSQNPSGRKPSERLANKRAVDKEIQKQEAAAAAIVAAKTRDNGRMVGNLKLTTGEGEHEGYNAITGGQTELENTDDFLKQLELAAEMEIPDTQALSTPGAGSSRDGISNKRPAEPEGDGKKVGKKPQKRVRKDPAAVISKRFTLTALQKASIDKEADSNVKRLKFRLFVTRGELNNLKGRVRLLLKSSKSMQDQIAETRTKSDNKKRRQALEQVDFLGIEDIDLTEAEFDKLFSSM